MKEIECRITGRVQLVMFRDFVKRKARSLGLVGEVKNLSDGSVYTIAQGEEKKLLAVIEHLKRGSFLSHVENVAVVWKEPIRLYQSFDIVY